MKTYLARFLLTAGVVWVLQPFPDLYSLHQFLGTLPQASAESAKVIYNPPSPPTCDNCDITIPGPLFLDYEVMPTTTATLRRPANLLTAPYTDYPPGRIFTTITQGYGLMRSYAGELPIADRWAVVAYVQALQLSQHAELDALPAQIRSEASRWLK